jgi:hypothetical protein
VAPWHSALSVQIKARNQVALDFHELPYDTVPKPCLFPRFWSELRSNKNLTDPLLNRTAAPSSRTVLSNSAWAPSPGIRRSTEKRAATNTKVSPIPSSNCFASVLLVLSLRRKQIP